MAADVLVYVCAQEEDRLDEKKKRGGGSYDVRNTVKMVHVCYDKAEYMRKL